MNGPDHSLIFKWILGNSFAGFGLFIAWQQGWLSLVVASDASYLSVVMTAIFLIFWALSTYKAISLNREVNRFRAGAPHGVAADYMSKIRRVAAQSHGAKVDQATFANNLQAHLLLAIQPVNFTANLLILLGLIGTVIGFVIAVGGLGDALTGGDGPERVRAVLAQIVNGMGVALFTTLVGSILGGIWLQLHYQLLFRTSARLALEIVEHAELAILRDMSSPAPDTLAEARDNWSVSSAKAAGQVAGGERIARTMVR